MRPRLGTAFVIPLLAWIVVLPGCSTMSARFGPPRSEVSPSFRPDLVEKVAVVAHDASGKLATSPGSLRAIEDEFIQALVGHGYRVADRSQTEAMVREIHLQRSGYGEADAAKLGRMLNVSAVLIATVTESSVAADPTPFLQNDRRVYFVTSNATLGARLVHVETTEVLWVGSVSEYCQITDPASQNAAAASVAARALAKTLPTRLADKRN